MSRRISSPVFVGRAVELDRLNELRARVVADGHGETILVTGEAGIGKTRFLRELASQTEAAQWLVLRGACDEFGGTARPLSALAEMATALGRFLATEDSGELERPAWMALEALGAGQAAPPDTGSVVLLAQGLFRRISKVRPLMLIVDDLHWADESTRDLFRALARGLSECPAILVGAFRDDEVDRGHPLRAVLSAVHRHGTPEVVELGPLVREEAQRIAAAVSGGSIADDFDDLFERSDGNAFFLEELLAAPPGTLPQGVREVVFARLHALGADAILLAEVASLDTSAAMAVLASASEFDSDRFGIALDALTDSGTLVASAGEYAFRHALIRDVVYEQVTPRRKAKLHAQMAIALEGTGQATVAAVATHWIAAGDKTKALSSTIQAAAAAYAVGAIPESADWYASALRIWDEVPQAAQVASCSSASLRVRAANVFAACRRFADAVSVEQEALRGTISPAERTELLLQLSAHAWQSSGNEEEMMALSRDAWEKCRDSMKHDFVATDKIRLLASYAIIGILRNGEERDAFAALDAASVIADAQNLAIPAPLRAATVYAKMSIGSLEVVEAFNRQPDLEVFVHPVFKHEFDGTILISLGLHELNLQRSFEGVEFLIERGWLGNAFTLEARVAASLTALGRWREALERWRATKALVGPEALLEWSTLVSEGWGGLLVRTGEIGDARLFQADATKWTIPFAMQPFLAGEALTRVEFARIDADAAAARTAVSETLDVACGHHIASLGEAVSYAIGVQADLAPRTDRENIGLLGEIDHWFHRLRSCLESAPGRVNLYDLGMFIDQANAERARLVGEDSAEVWEDLADRWHALPRPYHEAYCRYRAAFALLMAPAASERKSARERAAAHLETALAISTELGAIYLDADIQRLRQSARIRPGLSSKPVARAEPTTPDGPILTPRELEVLRLLVAGDSNGQIAIRLGISVKTASVHVSNILRKMNADHRVEAAVRASRMGIAGLR